MAPAVALGSALTVTATGPYSAAGAMTGVRLETAGWLGVASAVLTIPLVLAELSAHTHETRLLRDLLGLFSTGISVYLFLTLRELLQVRFAFHEADTAIGFLIGMSIALFALSLVAHVATRPPSETLLGLAFTAAAAAAGGGLIIFALRLLRLPDRLFGYLRPYAFANIALGVCLASVVLVPLGVLASVVADTLMALIFFAAARRP
jgi:hypothetical protein